MFQSRIVVKTAVAGINSVRGASRRMTCLATGQRINDGLMKKGTAFLLLFLLNYCGASTMKII